MLGALKRLMAIGGVLVLCGAVTAAQTPESFAPEQINKGATIFAQHCSACHGARMADSQAAFDLRRFPRGQKNRFVIAVTRGKDNMPP